MKANERLTAQAEIAELLKGDKLYPYFDETGDMLSFSREYVIKDRTGVKHSYFETYTDAEHRLWTLESNQWQLVEGYPKKNQIGKIPVVYGQQPAVEREDVQNLIDRLNDLIISEYEKFLLKIAEDSDRLKEFSNDNNGLE